MFRDLSIRLKIPLRSLVLIVITATVVGGALIFRAYEDLKTDIRQNAESLAAVLADSLVAEISHDEVWRAFNLVSAALRAPGAEIGNKPSFIVVLDAHFKVFVASDAERFPMLADLPAIDPDFAQIIARLRERATEGARIVEPVGSEFFYLAMPIISDQTMLGSLVLGYPRHMFQPRFNRTILGAAVITLMIVMVMFPAIWYWGSHLADPLVALAAYMRNAPQLPDPETIRDADSRDEVGELTQAFKRMVAELRDKQALEQQVVASDRLAAIGRLSAGIAHEINNPLGGMLNAVNTLSRHADLDARTLKTLGLIERGLHQIKNTVGALLVEAVISREPLLPEDLEDVRTLALAQEYRNTARLSWRNELHGAVALPSTQVRQMLLNLLLNAFQSVPECGEVWADIREEDGALIVEVANQGEAIPEEHLPFLFEPFSSRREGGHGLGLWVNYQIVKQLGGNIEVNNLGGMIRFHVRIPVPQLSP